MNYLSSCFDGSSSLYTSSTELELSSPPFVCATPGVILALFPSPLGCDYFISIFEFLEDIFYFKID